MPATCGEQLSMNGFNPNTTLKAESESGLFFFLIPFSAIA